MKVGKGNGRHDGASSSDPPPSAIGRQLVSEYWLVVCSDQPKKSLNLMWDFPLVH